MSPRIGLIPWADAIEDFLDPLGLELSQFRDEMTGGWLFGYVEALALAGVDCTIVCFSRRRRSAARWRHRPTGARLLVLPVPGLGLRLRARLTDPMAWSARDATGRTHPGLRGLTAHQLAPYLVTPLRSVARTARGEGWRAILCQEYEYQRSDLCVLLARFLSIPAFATFQGGSAPRTGLERRLRPLAMRAWTGLIVADRSEAARVVEAYALPPSRIVAIPNPVALGQRVNGSRQRVRRELGIPEEATVLAWHGRVEMWTKGLDLLLDAWAELASRREPSQLRLLLIGNGRDREGLRARVEAGPGGVLWIDEYLLDRDRLRELLGAADLYAFPSRHEGFAVAPLEAMAAGLAVVAAAAPGIGEILPQDRDSGGIVVPVGDAGALATALAELIQHPEERERLSRAARRQVAERFSHEAVGRRLRSLLLRES